MKYTATQIKEWDTNRPVWCSIRKCEVWIPARAINYRYESWWSRLKQVFNVLIGRYDVLDWEGNKKR